MNFTYNTGCNTHAHTPLWIDVKNVENSIVVMLIPTIVAEFGQKNSAKPEEADIGLSYFSPTVVCQYCILNYLLGLFY